MVAGGEDERTGVDGGAAEVRIDARRRQGDGADADLGERAIAGDRAAEGVVRAGAGDEVRAGVRQGDGAGVGDRLDRLDPAELEGGAQADRDGGDVGDAFVARGGERAGRDGGGAGIGVAAGEGDRAGSGLGDGDARSGEDAGDRAGPDGVAGARQRAVRDRAVGERDRADGLGEAAEVEGAARVDREQAGVEQAVGGAEEQRARVDRRAGGVSGRRVERQRTRAFLDEGAGAGDDGVDRRRRGEAGGDDAVVDDRSAVEDAVERLVAPDGESGAGSDRDRGRVGQTGVAHRDEAADGDRGRSLERVVAGQGQVGRAQFDQPAARADHARRVDVPRNRGVDVRRERADRVPQVGRAREGQRAGVVGGSAEHDVTAEDQRVGQAPVAGAAGGERASVQGERAGAERVVRGDAQGPGVEGRAAGVALAARHEQRAGAFLDEEARPGDRAGQRGVGVARTGRHRAAVEEQGAVVGQRIEGLEPADGEGRPRGDRVTRAVVAQDAVADGGQHARADQGRALVRVGAGQRQGGRAELRQAAVADDAADRDRRVDRQRAGGRAEVDIAGEGEGARVGRAAQQHVGAEDEVVRERTGDRAVGRDAARVERDRARAEGGVRAGAQRALAEGRAQRVGVVARQGHVARAGLDEAAVGDDAREVDGRVGRDAAHAAAEAEGVGESERAREGGRVAEDDAAAQDERVAERARRRAVAREAARVEVEDADAEGRVGTGAEHAGRQDRVAGEGIRASDRQGTRPVLVEGAARAGDRPAQGGVRVGQAEVQSSRGEIDDSRADEGVEAFGRAEAQGAGGGDGDAGGAAEDAVVGRRGEDAGRDRRGAGVGVDAGEDDRAGGGLVDRLLLDAGVHLPEDGADRAGLQRVDVARVGVVRADERAVGDRAAVDRDDGDRLGEAAEVEGAAEGREGSAVVDAFGGAEEQRPGGDGGAARVGVGGGERQRARAGLGDRAVGEDARDRGDRVDGEGAVEAFEADAAGEGHAARVGHAAQREVAVHRDVVAERAVGRAVAREAARGDEQVAADRVAERVIRAEADRAVGERGVAGVGVRAGQGHGPRARLGESARPGHDASEDVVPVVRPRGQADGGAVQHDAAGAREQVDGLARVELEDRARGKGDPRGRAEPAGRTAGGDHAGGDGGGAGVGVRRRRTDGQRAGAGLGEAAVGDHPGQGDGRVDGHRVGRAAQVEGAAQRQRAVISGVPQGHVAAESDGVGQRVGVVVAVVGRQTAGVEGDGAGAEGRAGTDAGIVADADPAGVQGRRSDVGVGAGERERRGARLVQAAVRDDAAEGEIRVRQERPVDAAEVDRSGVMHRPGLREAAERDVGVEDERVVEAASAGAVAGEPAGVEGDDARGAAEAGIARELQRAAVQGDAAGERALEISGGGVPVPPEVVVIPVDVVRGPGEGERAGAFLHDTAGAGDAPDQRGVSAGRPGREHSRSAVEVDRAGVGLGLARRDERVQRLGSPDLQRGEEVAVVPMRVPGVVGAEVLDVDDRRRGQAVVAFGGEGAVRHHRGAGVGVRPRKGHLAFAGLGEAQAGRVFADAGAGEAYAGVGREGTVRGPQRGRAREVERADRVPRIVSGVAVGDVAGDAVSARVGPERGPLVARDDAGGRDEPA